MGHVQPQLKFACKEDDCRAKTQNCTCRLKKNRKTNYTPPNGRITPIFCSNKTILFGVTAVLTKIHQKQDVATSHLHLEFSNCQNIGICGQALVKNVKSEV